mmetsp:Transcript_18553/g.43999  ORF Transcript_18553/g.43999 Transcript_18553/m.43999 type:complete len:146 (+) Transcript_18553:53-490(+)|eukprot:CAMPEP_0185802310 /NCGR_PEP_ID=MMETSP1322-20130828/1933_1 /TAXON_ID=265543 /ORGANISM="Minutocellus polymorphus, Strain RCC2270" /LENGTH=145 /DNA_ID=CAMNT_0028498065 /DNA_START=53 /DNA_END=490 /DNA_ORIENTATION=+
MLARSLLVPTVLAAATRSASAFLLRSAASPTFASSSRAFSNSAMSAGKPISIIVEADIKPERMDEFLALIQKNAEGSRKEPGCQRFDVLRSQDDPNKFFFYEIYDDADAVAHHKAQPHFDLWTNFKESEGIATSVSKKAFGEFMT